MTDTPLRASAAEERTATKAPPFTELVRGIVVVCIVASFRVLPAVRMTEQPMKLERLSSKCQGLSSAARATRRR